MTSQDVCRSRYNINQPRRRATHRCWWRRWKQLCHQWSGGPSRCYRLWHWLWRHKWGVGWNQHLHISSFNGVNRCLEKNFPSLSPLLRAKLLVSHLSRRFCPTFCPKVEILIRQSPQAVTHGRDKIVSCVEGWEADPADAHLGVRFHQAYQAISRLRAEDILCLGLNLFLNPFLPIPPVQMIWCRVQTRETQRFSTLHGSVDQRVCHAGRVPEVGTSHLAKVVPCVVLKIARRNSHQRPLVYVMAVSTRGEFALPYAFYF